MEAATALAFGLAAVGVVAVPLLILQGRHLRQWRREARRLEAEAQTAKDILATATDGFLVWDTATGGSRASGRLAVLLNLPGGIGSTYDDVLSRFAVADAETLDRAVRVLRRDGSGFALLLPVAGQKRSVKISGGRAFHLDGTAAADVLWVRDAAAAATGNGVTGTDDTLRALCDALPFPVWLRRPDGALVFANRKAAMALGADGTVSVAGAAESALPNGRGIVGFAVPPAPGLIPGASPANGHWLRVLDSLPLAIAIFGSDTRLDFFNGAFARLWRLDDEALAGRPRLGQFLDRLRERRRLPEVPDYPAYRDEQIALFRTVTRPSEALMHLPDNRTVRRVIAPHPAGGLVFAFEDLSERLSLERSINELSAVQRETLDNLFEAVAVFGGDGRLKLHNPAFAAMWEIDGGTIGDGIHIGDFAERMNARIGGDARPVITAARLMKREPGGGRMTRIDGSVVEYATVPLPDGAVLISFLNVTDSAEVEMALRQRAEALDEANRLKSDFIANVSYEIRTPLTTLSGFAEILTEEYFGTLNRRQKEYCQGILETSQTLTTVVRDILDLASIEAGTLTLGLDTVDIHDLLAGSLKLIRERSRLKRLKVEFDCPPDIGWIVADEKRVRQVVFNLLSNAVRFTGERGRLGLSARRDKDWVVIQVTDSGPGMTEEQVKRAVQPFARGADADGRGAGLGLSLVTRFVELHGGEVEIRSAPGRGTTVTCRLPTGAAPVAD